MNKALVTGANGFIGSHLIDILIGKGVNVLALVRDKKNTIGKWNDGVRVFEGDITNKASLAIICKDVDMVFHLASKVHDFSETTDNKDDYYRINVEGTRNLLDRCIGLGIKHFIFFSSIKAMVEEGKDTLDETFTPKPETPYGRSKLIAEELVSEYGEKYGFKTTSLRLPLVYGSGNKGNMYKMIKAIDNGCFVMAGRGENKRSMVYVGNVIDATLSVVEKQRTRKEIYIVTDGVDYTVKELYSAIAKEIGKKPLPFYVPLNIAKVLAFMGDVGGKIAGKPLLFNSNALEKLSSSLTFSSLKIQNEIGFRPRYNLYNTITEILEWYKNSK